MGGSERRSGSTFGIADDNARPCCSVVGAEYRYYPLAVLGSRIAVLGRVRRERSARIPVVAVRPFGQAPALRAARDRLEPGQLRAWRSAGKDPTMRGRVWKVRRLGKRRLRWRSRG